MQTANAGPYYAYELSSRLYIFFSAHQSFVTISNSPQVPQLTEPRSRDSVWPLRWEAKGGRGAEGEKKLRHVTKVSLLSDRGDPRQVFLLI